MARFRPTVWNVYDGMVGMKFSVVVIVASVVVDIVVCDSKYRFYMFFSDIRYIQKDDLANILK